MKLLLTSLLMLLLPTAIMAMDPVDEDLYIYDCQVQYNIQLSAFFEEHGKVAICSDDEMNAITNLIHSVVEQDYISAMLGVAVPQFMMAYEAFADQAIVLPQEKVKKPDAVEIAAHLTMSDIKIDIEMEGCGDEDPNCDSLEDEDEDEDEDDEDEEEDEDEDERRRLQEATYTGTNEWTPIVLQSERHLGKKKPKMDCETWNTCKADWCCGVCSHCGKRRRSVRRELQNVAVRTNGNAKTKAEKKAIRKFEKRVGRLIKKQLRRFARKEGAPCLGNYWQLEVDFTRNFFEVL